MKTFGSEYFFLLLVGTISHIVDEQKGTYLQLRSPIETSGKDAHDEEIDDERNEEGDASFYEIIPICLDGGKFRSHSGWFTGELS